MRRVLGALVAVIVLGTAGYTLLEKMPLHDALLSTVSVMATVGAPPSLTAAGKLFTAALIVASVGILVAAFTKFFSPQLKEEEETLTSFFSTTPQTETGLQRENLIMKEINVGNRSPLAGLQKRQVLEKYGVVVVGAKRKSGFDINVPMAMRVKSGSTVLLLGTPATILGVERKKRKP